MFVVEDTVKPDYFKKSMAGTLSQLYCSYHHAAHVVFDDEGDEQVVVDVFAY